MNRSLKGAFIASAVAGLIGCASSQQPSTAAPAETSEGLAKCEGINECKGQGLCGGADHECAGKNECKGKGWVKVTPEECQQKGGTLS